MVILTEAEKKAMCATLAEHLPKLRKQLNVTQAELGYLCGFSRIRVSQIETGKAAMSWSQLTSVMFVCELNIKAKEYIYANGILSPKFLQFIQRKDENIPPDINVGVRPEVLSQGYQQLSMKSNGFER
ncbi:MAG: helix-turn-helix transcriptional regulator [Clostridia bacterium]|nr:helix-turn-helix transcriptional regulator [Clostridia bacterium]